MKISIEMVEAQARAIYESHIKGLKDFCSWDQLSDSAKAFRMADVQIANDVLQSVENEND